MPAQPPPPTANPMNRPAGTDAAAPASVAAAPRRVMLYPLTWQLIGAAACVLGAGILHFVYAPVHLAEARGQGIFFLGLGFVQVGWAAVAARSPSPRTYVIGLVAATVMPAIVYLAARFIPAPFSDEAEGFDVIGWAVLLSEIVGAVLLAWHGLRQGIEWHSPDISPVALMALLVAAGLVLAAVTWGLGLAFGGVDWLADPEGGEHHHGEEAADPDAAGATESSGHVHSMSQPGLLPPPSWPAWSGGPVALA